MLLFFLLSLQNLIKWSQSEYSVLIFLLFVHHRVFVILSVTE